jgi:DNA-binding NtrC family response regulator
VTTAAAKPTLLLVDDEERILRSLAMMFRPHFRVLATTEPRLAIDCVRRERVNVIVSDQRMPQMLGADLLREIRGISPNTMRILLTGYSELDAVVASVNEGEIFRFVSKPWDAQELRSSVQQAASIAEGLFAAQLNPHSPETSGAAILVIDSDPSVTLAVRELAPPDRRVIGTSSIEAALEELARHEIGVIVSELQVGAQSVVPLLKVLKAQHPQVVTLVMTPFRDINVLVGLINQGQVFRFLPKPLRRNLLSTSLIAAMARHCAMVSTPALQAAHRVESMKEASEVSMASRISGFLSRLRGRISPGLEPGRA